jgi:NtrC-family two-component system response regulator AlgB
MAFVLIVDDEKSIRTMLASYVRAIGHEVEVAENGHAALELLGRTAFDLVFSDVRMADLDGLALLREIHSRWPDIVIVLMTAYATVPQAVEAIQAGAYGYLVKPFSIDQVGRVVGRALEAQRLRLENHSLRTVLGQPVLLESSSPAMRRTIETAQRAADSDATVLLTGESGTGKGVLAAAVHRWSLRAGGPFVPISCTTLSEHLLESELFGHVKGAFTGALVDKAGRLDGAAGGTLFLDEIGELTPPLQRKLLRFLEERRFERVGGRATVEIDARVLATTNRDLESDVAAGTFREDLFHRLNVLRIELPPLRDRSEDLIPLARHILAIRAARRGRSSLALQPSAEAALARYRWPGNVRELVNALAHAVVVCRGSEIAVDDLPDLLQAPAEVLTSDTTGDRCHSLEHLQRKHIGHVLAESATLEEAAARLGISSTTLWRKRKRYGIE